VIAAAFGIVLLSIVVFSIIQPGIFGSVGWVGGDSLLFIVIYFFAMRAVYNYEKRPKPDALVNTAPPHIINFTLKYVVLRYVAYAALVVIAAIFLPYYGEDVAEYAGISRSVFGTVFLAVSTSLPEIVISIMAVRQGSIDLAVGNVLGSNVFNIFILAINDIVYTKGPILNNVSPDLLVPAMGTILITTIGIIGLVYKSKRKWMLGIDSFIILLVYLFMMKIMFSAE